MATVEERVVEEEGEREAEHDLQPAEERWEDKAQVEAQQAEDNDQGTAHVDGIKYDDPVLSSGGWRMRRGREVGRNEKEGQVGRMRRGRGGRGMRRWWVYAARFSHLLCRREIFPHELSPPRDSQLGERRILAAVELLDLCVEPYGG